MILSGGARMTECDKVSGQPHPWQQLFADYAQCADGWVAGDSAYPVTLSNGTKLWLFSDSIIGPTRRWVHNCIVVQEPDGHLRTRYDGTAAQPESLVNPAEPIDADNLKHWMWIGDGFAVDDADLPVSQHRLWAFCQEFRRQRANDDWNEWNFCWVRSWLIEFSLPDLKVLNQTPINDGTGIRWGAAVLRDDDQAFIYGVLDQGDQPEDRMSCMPVYLAKANIADMTGQWRYRASNTWSATPEQATQLLTGVSTEFSVRRIDATSYVLVACDTAKPRGQWPIVEYRASTPEGPWTGPELLYDPPEVAADPTEEIYAYNPKITRDESGELVLIYNVNSTFNAVLNDPSIYRPKFRRIQL